MKAIAASDDGIIFLLKFVWCVENFERGQDARSQFENINMGDFLQNSSNTHTNGNY